MKQLVPIPPESVEALKREEDTGMGYHVIAVTLRDGRRYEQAVASEGCIIEVRGYREVPFASNEIRSVTVNHKDWNFRKSFDGLNT